MTLHASQTNTLLHAEKSAQERSFAYIIETLTDQNGEVLVDQNGEVLVAYGQTLTALLHAPATNRLLHAEDSE